MEKQRTFFIDIDGTLLKHQGNVVSLYENIPEVLPEVHTRLQEWHKDGAVIILTTARLPSMRDLTVKQLEQCHIMYHHLIMGIGRGERIVINDAKSDLAITALAYTVPRNEGLGSVSLGGKAGD